MIIDYVCDTSGPKQLGSFNKYAFSGFEATKIIFFF